MFFAWIPLTLMAISLRSRKSSAIQVGRFAGLSVLLCLYVLYMEFIGSRKVVAPIRVDLLLLIPLFSGLYIAAGLWGLSRWAAQKSTLLLISSLTLLAISGPTIIVFATSMWNAERHLAKLDSIDSLLFEAQFQNEQNFTKTFGSIDRSKNPIAGHYQSSQGIWATRVIINTEGHLWLYFRGSNTESVVAQADLNPATRTLPASVVLHPPIGEQEEGEFTNVDNDQFTLSMWNHLNGQRHRYMTPVTFVRVSPPYRGGANSGAEVNYLGAFAQSTIRENSVEPIQLWLWRSGRKFIGYYVRGNFACGSENSFISATMLEGQQDGGELRLAHPGGIESVLIRRLSDTEIEGEVIYNGRPLEALNLKQHVIFKSDRYEVAPLSKFEETKTWLETVSMGHMLNWRAECVSF